MIVAVFGDVHGNLSGMYELCGLWQQDTGERIDLVLQTGDMGLWDSYDQMDKATRKHFAKDRSELAAAEYLSGDLAAPIETWFVHGNHENFALLAQRQGQAVDTRGRIIFLAPGSVREFRRGRESLRIAALGGMEYRFGKYPILSDEPIQKYLHPPSLQELAGTTQVDVLLLHDAPVSAPVRRLDEVRAARRLVLRWEG